VVPDRIPEHARAHPTIRQLQGADQAETAPKQRIGAKDRHKGRCMRHAEHLSSATCVGRGCLITVPRSRNNPGGKPRAERPKTRIIANRLCLC
jgi:hypothetical protein